MCCLLDESDKDPTRRSMTAVTLWLILNIFIALAAHPSIDAEKDKFNLLTKLPKKLQKVIKGVGADCTQQLQGVINALLDSCDPDLHECEDQIEAVFKNAPPNIDWLEKLAFPPKDGLLWAGFWDGGDEGRTTKDALFDFAKLMDMTTVHPSTKLGTVAADNDDLSACRGGNPTAQRRSSYFWTTGNDASESDRNGNACAQNAGGQRSAQAQQLSALQVRDS